METAGKTLLFDPFITPNALAGAISLDRVKADYILISRGHFDHIADAVDLALLPASEAPLNALAMRP